MSDKSLRVEIAVNGFVVYVGKDRDKHESSTYAFESAKSLGKFMLDWGEGNTRVETKPENGLAE